jgi:hypothetical protein
MTRETRFNLIFLVIVLIFVIPGGVMLFKARMQPSAPSMFQPDFSHHQKQPVYNDFSDTRSTGQGERLAPSTTTQWVQYQTVHLFNPEMRSHIHWFKGLASAQHRFEIPAIVTSAQTGTLLVAVVWDPQVKQPSFLLGRDRMAVVGQYVWDLSPMIRRELQKAGFAAVPDSVTAYMLQSSETAPNHTLVVSFKDAQDQVNSDTLPIPPMSEAEYPSSDDAAAAKTSPAPATSPKQ